MLLRENPNLGDNSFSHDTVDELNSLPHQILRSQRSFMVSACDLRGIILVRRVPGLSSDFHYLQSYF
jgi:hypothetical protein